MTQDPACASVRADDAIFAFVLAAALEHVLHDLLHMFAIPGMHDLQQSVKRHWLRIREAEQLSPFLRYPKFVTRYVPNPQAEVCRVGCEINTRFAFPERGFAGVELLGKFRRAEEVVAQFIAHRHDDSQVGEPDEVWRFDHSPD